MPTKPKHPQSNQRKALAQTIALFIILSVAAVAILLWTQNATDSELAQKIRQTIGLSSPTEPTPAPVIITESEPEPELPPVIAPEPEPEPEPTSLSFNQIASRTTLWPRELKLQEPIDVPISYRGNNYGELKFPAGAIIKIDSLRTPAAINGYIEGNYLSIPVSQTNFVDWFNQTYQKTYVTHAPIFANNAPAQNDILNNNHTQWTIQSQLLYWLQRNYGDCRIEITENTLEVHWNPKTDVAIDYRAEAREISHQYLMLQAEKGGQDNYASCEIYYTPTGQLMGTGSIFVSSLNR